MPLQRIRVISSNFAGAPGYSTFYSAVGSPPPLSAIQGFFNSTRGLFPTGMTFTFPSSGDEFSEVTGQITGSWTAAAPGVQTGNGVVPYVGSSGAVVEWKTSAVLDGRRPIGKTFMVPFIASAFDNDGSLSTSALNTLQTAANTLVTGTLGQLFVWHRPIKEKTPPHAITRVGGLAQITSAFVPDLAAVMRTRRR